MVTTDLVALLNQTAAGLLVMGDQHPAKIHDMRALAVRLQIMAMRLEEHGSAAGGPTPPIRLFG